MKTTIKIIAAASLALMCVACGDAMNEPIGSEARSAQQLDLQNADVVRLRPTIEHCLDCNQVIMMYQSASDEDEDGEDNTIRIDKKQIDRAQNAFDGDPVPWPLDEKREE